MGVSDAIITKRFNRNSVAQSHVYDHRSLAEDLKAIEIPEEAKSILSGKAEDTFRMITAGLAKGPICLLYTSPSPRDKRQSRMPSSA